MKRFEEFLYGLNPFLICCIAGPLTIAQIVLAFFLNRPEPEALEWAGWICLWTAGIFGMLPIFIFRKKGGVPKGESYMETTRLVDTGLYAIVRHPQQGVSWLLINLGVMLVAKHWSSIVLGVPSIVLVYLDTMKADQDCIEKFGDAYRQYMQKVPRVDFVSGALRLLKR